MCHFYQAVESFVNIAFMNSLSGLLDCGNKVLLWAFLIRLAHYENALNENEHIRRHQMYISSLTLMRLAEARNCLAFFDGLILKNLFTVKNLSFELFLP